MRLSTRFSYTESRMIGIMLIASCLFSGCVVSNATRLTTESYAPVPAEQVAIYLSEDDIPGEYIKIGLINAKGNHGATDESQMLNKMRKDAGDMGANGILYQSIDEPGTGAKIAGAVLGVGVNRKGQVIAILVEDENTGPLETMKERQQEIKESLPEEFACKSPEDTRTASLQKVSHEGAEVLNTTGPFARGVKNLSEGDYVLRVDSYGNYYKICYNKGYGYVKKEFLGPG